MKKFSAFLSEAERSWASKEAEKLSLSHVGYGKYANLLHLEDSIHLLLDMKNYLEGYPEKPPTVTIVFM